MRTRTSNLMRWITSKLKRSLLVSNINHVSSNWYRCGYVGCIYRPHLRTLSFLFSLVHSRRTLSVHSAKFCLSEHHHPELWVHGRGTFGRRGVETDASGDEETH